MTARVVTKKDVDHVLTVIKEAMLQGSIDEEHARQFVGIVLFGAFTGQRPYSTIAQLRVEQLQEALKLEKPVVHVEPAQDKIRMEHYVPLHPQLASVIEILCDGREVANWYLSWKAFGSGCRSSGYPYQNAAHTSSSQICESLPNNTATSSDGTSRIVPIS